MRRSLATYRMDEVRDGHEVAPMSLLKEPIQQVDSVSLSLRLLAALPLTAQEFMVSLPLSALAVGNWRPFFPWSRR
jgi:hypothetical protein